MDLIIFDLDGTLVDSRQDIATSVNELLSRLGRSKLPPEQIFGFIGNGVRKLLERSLGVSATPAEVDRAFDLYLPIYGRHLLDTTRPYEGVREALEALDALRPERSMAVLTNKPFRESLAVLQGLALDTYFRQIRGGESFSRRKPDRMGVDALIESVGARRERTLMVGDSRVDLETARNAEIPVSLVTYGIGAAEVASLSPDYIIDDLRQLIPIVEGLE
jgi:phosphoglycolate phosphatase